MLADAVLREIAERSRSPSAMAAGGAAGAGHGAGGKHKKNSSRDSNASGGSRGSRGSRGNRGNRSRARTIGQLEKWRRSLSSAEAARGGRRDSAARESATSAFPASGSAGVEAEAGAGSSLGGRQGRARQAPYERSKSIPSLDARGRGMRRDGEGGRSHRGRGDRKTQRARRQGRSTSSDLEERTWHSWRRRDTDSESNGSTCSWLSARSSRRDLNASVFDPCEDNAGADAEEVREAQRGDHPATEAPSRNRAMMLAGAMAGILNVGQASWSRSSRPSRQAGGREAPSSTFQDEGFGGSRVDDRDARAAARARQSKARRGRRAGMRSAATGSRRGELSADDSSVNGSSVSPARVREPFAGGRYPSRDRSPAGAHEQRVSGREASQFARRAGDRVDADPRDDASTKWALAMTETHPREPPPGWDAVAGDPRAARDGPSSPDAGAGRPRASHAPLEVGPGPFASPAPSACSSDTHSRFTSPRRRWMTGGRLDRRSLRVGRKTRATSGDQTAHEAAATPGDHARAAESKPVPRVPDEKCGRAELRRGSSLGPSAVAIGGTPQRQRPAHVSQAKSPGLSGPAHGAGMDELEMDPELKATAAAVVRAAVSSGRAAMAMEAPEDPLPAHVNIGVGPRSTFEVPGLAAVEGGDALRVRQAPSSLHEQKSLLAPKWSLGSLQHATIHALAAASQEGVPAPVSPSLSGAGPSAVGVGGEGRGRVGPRVKASSGEGPGVPSATAGTGVAETTRAKGYRGEEKREQSESSLSTPGRGRAQAKTPRRGERQAGEGKASAGLSSGGSSRRLSTREQGGGVESGRRQGARDTGQEGAAKASEATGVAGGREAGIDDGSYHMDWDRIEVRRALVAGFARWSGGVLKRKASSVGGCRALMV